jgi:hypothetical protein
MCAVGHLVVLEQKPAGMEEMFDNWSSALQVSI